MASAALEGYYFSCKVPYGLGRAMIAELLYKLWPVTCEWLEKITMI
jgi:hypothetical protein